MALDTTYISLMNTEHMHISNILTPQYKQWWAIHSIQAVYRLVETLVGLNSTLYLHTHVRQQCTSNSCLCVTGDKQVTADWQTQVTNISRTFVNSSGNGVNITTTRIHRCVHVGHFPCNSWWRWKRICAMWYQYSNVFPKHDTRLVTY